ncbi:MAG: 50S ribosomal protein L11 methyltransferase [Proteobacteria bacterium]|nr:50S ribosomal protein L11 methyltransferase [Pseudomonadota bacterium]
MHELRLICPQERVDLLSDALEALEALSVSVEDADADTQAEHALFGEPGLPPPAHSWERSRVLGLFPDAEAAREAARLLALQDFFDGCEVQAIAPVADQDWVRLTQSQFEPVPITPEFWIVPTWHQVPAQARQVIRLDPGLAFGTGTHPTTRMCLRWIAAHPPAGQRVLDYGCGSGILAIGAALHGAAQVDAVDIDEAAVQSTQDNAAANGVQLVAGLPDRAQGAYETVLANILATPLKVLAPLLAGHVGAGGALVLAGVLERQTEELQAAYRPYLALRVADAEDGWVLLEGRRA